MSEKTTDSGLKHEELREGDGKQAASGRRVSVYCTGWLLAVAG